ncbi:MAG: SEL1-like repeat protein [Candidatus Methanomethylophilaceae archaeon]|jgi:hypothetical protein
MDQRTAKEKCELALKYIAGHEAPKDPVFAAGLFKEVADAGYPNGQFGYAELLMNGNGVQQDIPRAMEMYNMAAVQNHPAAMFRLASMMMEEGPNQDIPQARSYFLKCADLGMTMAFIVAGDINFYGMGGEPDMAEAFRWYEMAALEGDPIAEFKCGYMLENGVGTQKDEKRSIEMFRSAAEKGIPEAQFRMASLAYDGKVPGGKAECAEWYRRCAEKGYPAAMFNLAGMLYDGDGIEKDLPRSFRLYKQVAEETNDGDAYFMLGRMYLEGLGTEKNAEMGFQAIGKAADAGCLPAQQLIESLRRRQNTQLINIDGTE